jgi:hypothetical protein
MLYTKPQILDSCRAHECVLGIDKHLELVESGSPGMLGTPAAYEADE